MRDARIIVDLALLREAVTPVEIQRMCLREQHDILMPALARQHDEPLEDGAAHALVAPLLQHRHPADMAVGQQTAGADRLSAFRARERVHGNRVVLVQFHLLRNALLLHEHRKSDRSGLRARLAPRRKLDP